MQPIVLTRRGVASLFLTAALARPAMAALPPTQAELVSRVEAYFNGIQTLQASFQQLAPDGGLTTGKLYIDRTREAMRFSYDPPSKIRLVAPGDWRVIFYDAAGQVVETQQLHVATPNQWTCMKFTQGKQTDKGWFYRKGPGDPAKVVKVQFAGTTKEKTPPGTAAAVIWDDFKMVEAAK